MPELTKEERLKAGLTPKALRWWEQLAPMYKEVFLRDMYSGFSQVGYLRECINKWAEEDDRKDPAKTAL